jgi:ribosomal protein S18 acetylase RimI-like enzyme
MMHGLYSEDKSESLVDESHFPLTIDFFLANPSRGRIVLFQEGNALRGYSLLVPYWSNEFGGPVVVVDELFVTPQARNRGIARSFFRFLGEERPFEAVALALEVNPGNTGALRLYQSLGFACRHNSLLTYRLP